MVDDVPAVVTVHLWRAGPGDRIAAMARRPWDSWALRRTPGLRFSRILGTARGAAMTPGSADLDRWALISCWSDVDAAEKFEQMFPRRGWRGRATEICRLTLRPLSSNGRWSGREPFGRPDAVAGEQPEGPIAVLTRARLTVRAIKDFRLASGEVANALVGTAGLRMAVGVGELPIGLQGTLSVWDSPAAMARFAYADPTHRRAMRVSRAERWYSEDLFARFAVIEAHGTVNGQELLR